MQGWCVVGVEVRFCLDPEDDSEIKKGDGGEVRFCLDLRVDSVIKIKKKARRRLNFFCF